MGGVAITLRAFGLKGPEGPIFGPVDAHITEGQLVAVVGPEGSGRSSFLLAVSGRVSGTTGSGRVGPVEIPAPDVRRLMAAARITDVVENDEHRRVGELVGDARLDPQGPADELLGDRGRRYGDLPRAERLYVDLGLALATGAAGIVIDDIDAGVVPKDLESAWGALRSVADLGVTVLASATAADPRADVVIDLERAA